MRSISIVALALATFAAVAALVGRAAPLPPPADFQQKLVVFERERDTTDVLFFGSSHVHRGVDPQVFDDAMRAAGFPVSSFNFAMPSMRSHEANRLLRHVLAMRPSRVRWVVLEWGRWDPRVASSNWWKERPVFWHDAPETRSVIESVWLADFGLPAKLRLTNTHAMHFLQRSLAVGRGPAALRALIGGVEPVVTPGAAAVRRRGFSPFSPSEYRAGPTAEHRNAYLADLEAFEASLRTLPRENREPAELRKANLNALASQVETVRAAGAEPIYLVMPIGKPTPLVYALAAAGRIPRLIAFNDPDRYPELYRPDARFDRGHLDARGAEMLSRELALRFAEIVGARTPD